VALFGTKCGILLSSIFTFTVPELPGVAAVLDATTLNDDRPNAAAPTTPPTNAAS
jgi:hypothetical protein